MKSYVLVIALIMVVMGVIFGVSQSEALRLVETLGFRIPSKNISLDFIIANIWAIAIFVTIFVAPGIKEDRLDLAKLWTIRCAVTLGAMLFYEYKYGLDAYTYYLIAINEYFDVSNIEIGMGSNIVSGIGWIMNTYLPIFSSYHAMKVLFSALGLLSSYIFYKGVVLYTEKPSKKLLYSLGIVPSMLFWSSIFGKDPLSLFGIAIYAYGVLGFLKTNKFKYLNVILCGVAIAASIRIWAGIIFVLPLMVVYLIASSHSKFKKLVFALAIVGGAGYVIQNFTSKFQIESSDTLIQTTQSYSRSWSRGGSGQEVPEFQSLADMAKFAPVGIFTALFRPLPGEVANIFGLLAGTENLVLLILLAMSLNRGLGLWKKDPVTSWLISTTLTWGFFYGFVSYQNLGSASRFRLQIMPLILILIYLLNQNKKEPKQKGTIS